MKNLANGNFYFASYFFKKKDHFDFKNKTLPYIIKNKKFNIDIDSKKKISI